MSDASVDSQTGRSPLLYGGIALTVIVVLLLLNATCRRPADPSGDAETGGETSADISKDHCDRILEGVLDGLRPERVGITSDQDVLVDALNNWLAQCAPSSAIDKTSEDRTLRESLLPQEMFEQTQFMQFVEQDAGHIRDQLLARGIVDVVTAGLRSDRERARELFYYVVRNVDLLAGDESGVPLTPYEILVFGVGTAKDRAWVFANLLRQLRLDAVILQPLSSEGKPLTTWLVGVLLPEDGVLLFDFRLGLPLPSPDDDPHTVLIQQVATLSQARADDSVLRLLDVDGIPYPLSSEDLKHLSVKMIADSSLLSPRMALLQAAIDDRGVVNLSSRLGPSELRPIGLVQRITNAGEDELWAAEHISVWDYPEDRWRKSEGLTDEATDPRRYRNGVLRGPWVIVGVNQTEQGAEPIFGLGERSLREGRVQQILGHHDEARAVYLNARLSEQMARLSPQFADANQTAADWAEYWVGASQFELGDYKVASESLTRYLKGAQTWELSARYLLALSLAQQQLWEEAANLLRAEPAQAPQHAGNQWLAARWELIAHPPAETPEPNPPTAEDKSDSEAKSESDKDPVISSDAPAEP